MSEVVTIAPSKYSLGIRLIHWLTTIIIAVNIPLGLMLHYHHGLELADRIQLIKLHINLGVFLLFITAVRIIYKLRSKFIANYSFTKYEVKIYRVTQVLIYTLLILIPFSGYACFTMFGGRVYFLGFQLPSVFVPNEPIAIIMSKIHFWASPCILALIILHLTGYLKHLIVDKKNLISNIL